MSGDRELDDEGRPVLVALSVEGPEINPEGIDKEPVLIQERPLEEAQAPAFRGHRALRLQDDAGVATGRADDGGAAAARE